MRIDDLFQVQRTRHLDCVLALQAWLPARTYVREAIETRMEVDDSGEIMKLEHYCPWKEHLYELEQELTVQQPLKFCLYEVRYLTGVEADASILVALESLPLTPCVLAFSVLAPPRPLRPVVHMHYCCASLQHDSSLTRRQSLTPTHAISGPCRMTGEGSGGCRRNVAPDSFLDRPHSFGGVFGGQEKQHADLTHVNRKCRMTGEGSRGCRRCQWLPVGFLNRNPSFLKGVGGECAAY